MSETPTHRTLVVGDIHGCLDALLALEKYVDFKPEDEIILLGDYVDRGQYSKEVIDWILERRETHNIRTLIGNHEVMMENASIDFDDYLFWVMNGGNPTLQSFGCELEDIEQKYWNFFDGCELSYETEQFIFVHGGALPDVPIIRQDIDSLCWIRFRDLKAHDSGKVIICGHTPQQSHRPTVKPYAVCIDTHVYNVQGFLTCLDVNSGDYWQTSNFSENRRKSTLNMPSPNVIESLQVVCAVIKNRADEILVCQRSADTDLAGLWEFPGGKIEPGETDIEAIKREIEEELGVTIQPFDQFEKVEHQYPDFHISLYPFLGEIQCGKEPQALEHECIKWIPLDQAKTLEWAEADKAILRQIQQRAEMKSQGTP